MWPTGAPFTLWPTGAPQPTPITNFPTTTYYPSFTPAPSPTAFPSSALPTPSYANIISSPTSSTTSEPTAVPTFEPSSVPTAAPSSIYWILGQSGENCVITCSKSEGVCIESYFATVINYPTFAFAMETSKFSGDCTLPGTLYYNRSDLNATSFCGYSINSPYDPVEYIFPAGKVVGTLLPPVNGVQKYGYEISCGYGETPEKAAQGKCNSTTNLNLNRLCPCDTPCKKVGL